MSGDLISRSKAIKITEEEMEKKLSYEVHNAQIDIMFRIKEMPTAYDVEKVIQQLEENKTDAIKTIRKVCDSCFAPEQAGNLVELLEVYTREQIEIVKKGGV